jgi:hypothetical protein
MYSLRNPKWKSEVEVGSEARNKMEEGWKQEEEVRSGK